MLFPILTMTDQVSAQSAMATAHELLFQAFAATRPGYDNWYLTSPPYSRLDNSEEAPTSNGLYLRMEKIAFPQKYFPSGTIGLQQISNAALVTYVLAQDLAEKELREITAARQRTKRKTEVKSLEELIAELPAWETVALVLVGAGHEQQGNAERKWHETLTDAELHPWKAAEAIYASAQHQFEHMPAINYLPENVKSEAREVLLSGLVNTRIRLGLEAYRQGTQLLQGYQPSWRDHQSKLVTAAARFKEAASLYASAEKVYRQAEETASIEIKDGMGRPANTPEGITRTFAQLREQIETEQGNLAKLILH